MRIWIKGTDSNMRPYEDVIEEGSCIGIRDLNKQVVIECQDLTHTVVIQGTFEEFERAIRWCGEGRR